MNRGSLISFGALGVAVCIGGCAALGFLPAMVAGAGAALLGARLVGWEIVGAAALLVAGGVWLLLRRGARKSYACGSAAKGEGNAP